jgi:hypothetical protein
MDVDNPFPCSLCGQPGLVCYVDETGRCLCHTCITLQRHQREARETREALIGALVLVVVLWLMLAAGMLLLMPPL